jgi:hypothetical protein
MAMGGIRHLFRSLPDCFPSVVARDSFDGSIRSVGFLAAS